MPSKRRATAPWCVSGKLFQQLIQVIQVILTLLSQRFLATIKVVQFSALAVQVVPARARAAQLGLGRGRPLRSRRCPRSSFR